MPYHHGNLGPALIDAGLQLARVDGPEAVVLRAATRAANVSHNAAYRHFADRDALLRAVCEQCMRRLAILIERRVDELPAGEDAEAAAWAVLFAIGRAYVEFALTEPGWFRTAFAVPRSLDYFTGGEGAGESGLGPYDLLAAGLDTLVDVGALPAERRPGAEFVAWSAVHGLATLLIDGPLRGLVDPERQVAVEQVLVVIGRGL